VRSNYFLIALGVCVFLIYSFVPPVDAGYRLTSLGNYRGFYNSAWIGSMVATCVPFFTLIGFYLVNNAVQRDRETGVGQIIATTRITRLQYLTGKLFSNFSVLLVMIVVIMIVTVIMFFVRAETNHLELGKLLLPLLILTVPAMFILSAIALFFDTLPGVSRSFINIIYFFFWIFLVSSSLWSPLTDVFGVNASLSEIKHAIAAAHPDWNGESGTGILISDTLKDCKVFTWDGMQWTFMIFLQRIFWMIAAFGLVLVASLMFDRFDSPGVKEKKPTHPLSFLNKKSKTHTEPVAPTIRYRELPPVTACFSFFKLVKAELTLMLSGNSRWWLIITAGLFVASMFVPISLAQLIFLPLLWFVQILVLSKQGCREFANRCDEYIFSAAFPLKRQLPATITAGVMITLTLAVPVLLRVLLSGNLYGMYAIVTGALFIPVFAITLGILTGGSKLFEVLFTIIVYGILNKVPLFDLTGAMPESAGLNLASYILVCTILMVVVSFVARGRQVRS
jgi:hypothetical protein